SPEYRSFIEADHAKPDQLLTVSRGQSIGPWVILHPDLSDHFSKADENAVVLMGKVKGARVLLLSELGEAGQEALAERNPSLRADIVIAGLPTKGEPVEQSLLQMVRPRLIIITDSELPVQQRATPRLKERL